MQIVYSNQANVVGLPLVAKATGNPIITGTVYFYLVARDGTNEGKWYNSSTAAWESAEASCGTATHVADGHWKLSVAATVWTASARYMLYAKESGALHVPVGEDSIFVSEYGNIASTDTLDTLYSFVISAASDAIESYTGRVFCDATYRESYDGEGDLDIVLEHYPVIEVEYLAIGRQDAFGIRNTSSDCYRAYITINETQMKLVVKGGTNAGTSTLTLASYSTLTDLFTAILALSKGWEINQITSLITWDASELLPMSGRECAGDYAYTQIPYDPEYDFEVDLNSGVISGVDFGHTKNDIFVKYTAGYTTLPKDVELACILLAKYYLEFQKKDQSVQSETIGDYSYTLKQTATKAGIPSDIKLLLEPYIRRAI